MLEIVILAAGASKRLGKSKQLLKINKEPLVYRVAKIACGLSREYRLANPLVVLGKDHEAVKNTLSNLPITTTVNKRWHDGMGSSITCAVENLNDDCSAILLMTCDQVLIEDKDIKILIEQWQSRQDSIIASSYKGITGIPVIFPSNYFKELLELGNSKGARGILKKYPEEIISIELPGAAHDLDTVEDEQKIRDILESTDPRPNDDT